MPIKGDQHQMCPQIIDQGPDVVNQGRQKKNNLQYKTSAQK